MVIQKPGHPQENRLRISVHSGLTDAREKGLLAGMNDDVRAKLDALERRQSLLRQELAGLDETLTALKQGLQNGPPPAHPQPPEPPPISPQVPPTAPPPLPVAVAEEQNARGVFEAISGRLESRLQAESSAPPEGGASLKVAKTLLEGSVGVSPASSASGQDARAPVNLQLPEMRPPSLPRAPKESSLEMQVGTVWLARIGIVIVLTGLVFLANYAWKSLVENFGSIAKLGLLYLAGGTLCAVGLLIERGRESLRSYSRILIAGGMAAIYYTTYAAYYVPSLKVIGSPLVAGLLLVAIAGVIGWMADRRNSQSTAALAILLAFYASAVNPIAYFTLTSNAILGVAAVVLMARKRWMAVPFLALAATYWSYFAWQLAKNWKFWEVHASGDHDLTLRLCFLSVYWIVFTAGAFLATGPKVAGATRVVFSTLNDAAFFCLAAFAISSAHHDSLWIVSLAFGLVQIGLSLSARKVYGPGTPTGSAWLAKGLFFLTLAVLIHFTGNSLAVILAVECSLLVFAASRLPSRVLAVAGPLAGVLAMIAGMASLSESGNAGAAGLVAALLAANAWFCGRRPDVTIQSLTLAIAGVALGFVILMNQLPDEWESAGTAFLGLVLVAGLPFHKCRELAFAGLLASAGSAMVQFGMLDSAGLRASLVALGLLTATAVAGPLVGRDSKLIRIPSGVLAVAATLLFWDWVNTYVPESHRFWLVAMAATITLLLSRERPLRQAVATILAVAALLIFLWHSVGSDARYVSADLFGCLLLLGGERIARIVRAPAGLARFAGIAGAMALFVWVTSAVRFYHDPIPLTAAWALLALALFFAGFLMRARIFRLGGLGILAIALCRIVLVDVWLLDLPLRILSFLVLGTVLLLLGYLYNRYADRIRQWL